MGKIKLNLVSGAVVEKPLVCGFKANNIEYVVLDNEMNGSMGLPIILVCKIDNNKVTKIVDQNEWQLVKEYLKNIIAGNIIEFVPVAKEMAADDIYYTQLTLPVPSFDALKKAYTIEDSSTSDTASILDINSTPVQNPIPEASASVEPIPTVAPVTPEPVAPAPSIQPAPTPVSPVTPNPMPDVMTSTAINPEPTPVMPNDAPTSINPTPVTGPIPEQVMQNPTSPVIDLTTPATAMEPTPVVTPQIEQSSPLQSSEINPTPVTPNVTPIPTVAPEVNNQNVTTQTPIDGKEIFKDQKEAFMQACENMFDALVQKFEKELQNK